ncbi:3'-5' exonuclease [Neiella marina]|uniref:3'-5' exonuclease n=1 Tax=Neiella holothuriorum TaxID=2870530 RepID=A0ABS7EK83_9GAMM|nr:3'-5' exonuclease [Neiella holothuriorum]MBW8192745.1 3'-5' exonuclease [Neiella holothuriorum]
MTKHYILDTETTGLDDQAEIVEIGVIEADTGKVVLQTLVKPTVEIGSKAQEVHGISGSMLLDAPSYDKVHKQLLDILQGGEVHIYNKKFDTRLIYQTANKFGLVNDELIQALESTHCVMLQYADLYRQPNSRGNFRYQTLVNAIAQQNIQLPELTAHRAVADCEMTRHVWRVCQQNSVIPYSG